MRGSLYLGGRSVAQAWRCELPPQQSYQAYAAASTAELPSTDLRRVIAGLNVSTITRSILCLEFEAELDKFQRTE